ncbi:hypothetical protein D5047_08830 [Verminephrobacter eiseniae]|nr:hypothetical protein [Verminephrobacter eiseniae]
MSAARPPEGAHTAAEGEGTPVCAARPPEGIPASAGPYNRADRLHGGGSPLQGRRRARPDGMVFAPPELETSNAREHHGP